MASARPSLRTCPRHPEGALNRQADGRWLCTSGHTVPSDLPTVREHRDPVGDYCRAALQREGNR